MTGKSTDISNDCMREHVEHVRALRTMLSRSYYESKILTPRYSEDKRLLKYGYKVYSQFDEDGIINEIFRRIGTTNRSFLEIGAGTGLENNTLNLLVQGWTGTWFETNQTSVEKIKTRLESSIKLGTLRVVRVHVTAEVIDQLVRSHGQDAQMDLLSIDIDGNDCWVWKALTELHPRVVVIEYNATLGSERSLAVPYNPDYSSPDTNYFGASLKALELIGRQKGYLLVGCNFTGVNAFFVREDLAADLFLAPYSAENHYEPARYEVLFSSGHKPAIGPFKTVQ